MLIKDIIKSLIKYQKEENNSIFIKECINYFKKQKKIELNKIDDNSYCLVGVKYHLLYNQDKYNIDIINTKPQKNSTYRKLNLTNKQKYNLINQIDGIINEKYEICNNIQTNNNILYFIIYEKNNKLNSNSNYHLSNYIYEISTLLLGIDSLLFLEHQNLENYCNNFILTNAKNSINMIQLFRSKLKFYNWIEKEKFAIFSGAILQFLGTLYTQDLDLQYIDYSNNINQMKNIIEQFNEFDIHTIGNNTVIIKDKKNNTKYINLSHMYYIYMYEFPSMIDVDNLHIIMEDPKYHFHFLGMKCFSLHLTYSRLLSRKHPFSFIDIYMMKKINNLSFQQPCIPNLTIRQGKVSITNDQEDLYKFYKSIKKYLKLWWNLEVSIEELSSIFNKCNIISQKIQNSTKLLLPDFIINLNKFIQEIELYTLKHYTNPQSIIIDFNNNKNNNLDIFCKLNIKKIIKLENSLFMIHQIKTKIDKSKNKVPMIIYNTNLNTELIDTTNTHKYLINKKIDVLYFNYNIHNYIHNINFWKNLDLIINSHSIIIIHCIDSSKFYTTLQKNNKYEILYNNDIIWGVYKFNDKLPNHLNNNSVKALFYFKNDTNLNYLNIGSEEYLINPSYLISKFKEINCDCILQKKYLDLIPKNKLITLNIQKNILENYLCLVFKKK